MKYIGAHLSSSGGIDTIPAIASSAGFTGFALFVKPPKRYVSSPIPPPMAANFQRECMKYGFPPESILPHASYLLNLANPDPLKQQIVRDSLLDEVTRCSLLGLEKINLHPGSDTGNLGEDRALEVISESLNRVLEKSHGVKLILECTVGKGRELGGKLEHLAKIISEIEDKNRIGVCIDTCHAFDAGYNIRDSYDQFWTDFDSIIGRQYLMGIHLNDSKYGLGSKKDRHADLGEGQIGWDFFTKIVSDSKIDGIPMILETPSPEKWEETVKNLII